MFKKLLTLAAFMAVGVGWGNLAHAQTDVTATYITNPGFEGDYTIKTTYQQGGSNERYIFEPDGWTVVHTNPNTNDLTCLTSSDKQSNSFSSYTMNHSGEQTYWARLRWGGQTWTSSGPTGKPTSIELQQQLTALPSGVYRLSADLLCYASGTEANNHVYLKANSVNNSLQVEPTINHSKSDGNWENKSLLITSTGSTEYTVGLQILQNWTGSELISGFDDVKLEKLSTSATEPVDITSFVPKGTSNWTNNGANNAGPFSNGGVTMVERYYNQHYTGTVSELTVKDLPLGLYEAEVYCHAHCADWNCSAIPEAAGQTDRTILSANNVEYGIPIVNDKSLTEGPQVRLLENISVTDGTLVFKVRNDQEGANWLTFEVKSLKYFGPTIAAEAVEFTSGATMEAGKWYYFDAPFATTYAFAAGTDLNNIVYTTDGSILLENALSVNNKFVASQEVEAKRYYFKSSEAQTFTFGPASYSYTVGDATSNIADGAYIQSLTTWTLEYASATSDDPDASFALVDGSAKAVLAKGGTPVAEGTLSLGGNTLTATFDGVTLDKESAYTLSLPAGVVGYEGQEANAAVSVAVNTPAVFDGHFYLYNTDTKTYLSRSGNYATQAILDNYGLAVILKTDATGKTTIQYFDSEYWLGDDGFCYGDCTGGRIRTYNVTKVEGGYKFLNTNNNMYLAVYNGAAVGDAVEGGNLQGTSNIWALESTADHVTNYTRNADAQVIAAVANVDELNSITTKAELESKLASDYQAIHIAITGAKAEKFNQYAGDKQALAENTYYSETVTGLVPGLYKLSVDAFQRAASNEKVRDADGARSIIYLYANGAKTQLKSVMDAYAETPYAGSDFVVNGKYYPNTETTAYTALETVDYSNDVYVYVAADGESETGTLKIGIKNPTRLGGDFATWAVYNNWTLTYYKEAASIVSATGITIDPASATVTTGETVTLTATVTPEDADDKTASWSSSDETVATVDNNGVVTAHKAGEATITASANGGESITATAYITVADATAPAFYASAIEDGVDYYIVNAATGKFLGGGNNYGTHASLIEHGIPFTITQEASGKYTLDSHVYNGKDSHYFKGDYVDQTSKDNIYITPMEGGRFSISTAESAEYVTAAAGNTIVANNAADANSSLAQWYFVSKTDRDKALAAATDQNPVDATYYIPNASFSRNMNTQYNENPWSVDATNSNLNSETNCAESYHSTFEVKKTITNLPNGSYKVRAQAVANNAETGAVVFINEGEDGQTAAFDVMQNGENNMATCAASFAAGRYYTEWIPVTIENHTLTLGVKGGVVNASWCVWDNFELYMTGYTPVTEVTASIDNSEIEVNGTAQITASVTEGASFDAISYVSSDVTVATVDENGLVTAVAEGSATITVKAEMENVSEEINVTVVKPAVIPSEITVMNGEDIITALELDATTNEVTLTAVVGKEGAPQAVVWASDDETVATVSAEGVVTGVAPGTASITVTASGYDDVYATVEVTVTYPESTIPATVEVIDETEMTKTIYTLDDTNLIKNGSFEYPDAYYGWTVGSGDKMTSSQFTVEEEEGEHYIKSVLHQGSNAAGSLRQAWSIEGKKYVLGYKVKNVSGTQVNNNDWLRVSLCNANPTSGDGDIIPTRPSYNGNWSETSVIVDNTASKYTFVQAHFRWLGEKGEHTSFDNFYLAEVTNVEVIDLSATAADYAALNAAIADAENNTLGFLQGEYAPYNNVAALQALAAAKAIDQEAKNWPADVQAATGALNTAIWTMNTEEVNAVYNGDFGLSTANTTSGKDVDAPGWVAADGSIRLIIDNATTYPALAETTAGKAAFAWNGTYNYGGKVGYTMPLAAHTVYELTFKHAGWNGANNNFSVSVKNSDNEGLATQSCGKSSAGPQTAGCWSTYVVRFTTGAAGDYTLSMMPNGNSTFTDITLFQVPVSEVTMKILKDNKYGTFVAPFEVTLPDGVTAQKVIDLSGTTLVMEDVNEVIPAHTPVVIYKGDIEDDVFTETFSGQATTTQTEATEGLLTGVYTGQKAPAGKYVLQNIGGKVAFYHVADGEEPTMRPYSAYLTLPEGYAKPISLSFGDDEATAIAGIEALTSGNMEGIYTTSGAKVNSLQKGVNIIRTKDGKSMKVYVK